MTDKIKPLFLTLLFLAGLAGCGSSSAFAPSCGSLSGVIFDRSHGSLWGIQFYISLTETEIKEARFFQPGASEQAEISAVPLDGETWEQVEQAVSNLLPSLAEKQEKNSLFGMKKLDGTEERTLTLTWKTENGKKTITYTWPSSEEAAKLEKLLEGLVQNK